MNSFVETHAWTTFDGLSIHGQSWQVEQPRALIVIVHGTGDHIGRFEELARQANAAGMSVFGADFRGNGKSAGTRGYVKSFEVLLRDLEQLLQQATRLSRAPVFLYGQSMGGLLSIYFTMKRNSDLAGVIASSPALGLAMKAPRWKLAIGRTLGKVIPKMSLPTGIKSQQLSQDPQRLEEFKNDRLRHRKMCASTFFSMIDTMQWCEQNADLLNVPTLIMHGDADTITCPEASQTFAERAGCQFKIWPGLLHELHHEQERSDVVQFAIDWMDKNPL